MIGTRILAVVVSRRAGWTLYRRRWRMLVTVVAAAASACCSCSTPLVDPTRAHLVDVGANLGRSATTASHRAGIGAVAAVLTAAAPWLSRRWRRAGWA